MQLPLLTIYFPSTCGSLLFYQPTTYPKVMPITSNITPSHLSLMPCLTCLSPCLPWLMPCLSPISHLSLSPPPIKHCPLLPSPLASCTVSCVPFLAPLPAPTTSGW